MLIRVDVDDRRTHPRRLGVAGNAPGTRHKGGV
jgi:hypothetical protein